MPTLGTQTISSSFVQLLKTFTTGGIDGALQVITDGDNTSSALSLSTTGVQSTGSFTVSSNSSLLGPVTFGSNITASTGTATIGTLSVGTQSVGTSTISTATISTATISTATISTATISTATIPLQLGAITFGSSITASTGTATIGTLSASTATISTATIPLQLGNVTFGSNITASTGTATIGTLNVSGLATVGSLEIGGTAGPILTKVSYGTAAFTGSTFQDLDSATAGSNVTTGTFAVTGAALGDIVFGGLTSIGSSTGTNATLAQRLIPSFRVESTDTIRYVILNTDIVSHGTTPAGTLFATAMRFTA